MCCTVHMDWEFCDKLESDGTEFSPTSAEAPWHNGRTERHGGIIKLMLAKADAYLSPALGFKNFILLLNIFAI